MPALLFIAHCLVKHWAAFCWGIKNNFMDNNNNASVDRQDYPHREGQQNNIAPQDQAQRRDVNESTSLPHRGTNQETEESTPGRMSTKEGNWRAEGGNNDQ